MREAITIGEALQSATAILKERHIRTPELDARILLEALTEYSHAQLISNAGETLALEIAEQYFVQIQIRAGGKPVHRIIGSREFFGWEFDLNEATLIPRPDTEILVEESLAQLNRRGGHVRVLEIGTGSGAIAVTLACEMNALEVVATDVSSQVLEQARWNSEKHGVADKISFVEASLFDGLSGMFDAIISNPPYIPSSDIASLDIEVREHDPILALDGGEDGLDFYREIFTNSSSFLKTGGFIALEIGIGQSDAIVEIADRAGFGEISKKADLSGVCRVITAQ